MVAMLLRGSGLWGRHKDPGHRGIDGTKDAVTRDDVIGIAIYVVLLAFFLLLGILALRGWLAGRRYSRDIRAIERQLQRRMNPQQGTPDGIPSGSPPPKRSEGVRRLSLATGIALCLVWTVLMLLLSAQPRADEGAIAVVWLVGTPILFVLGWGLVRLVAWVMAGFRLDRDQ
jgi:hypothetical protein